MDYGIGVGGPLTMIGPMAQMVEGAGFESCWAAETTNTAFIAAAAATAPTSTITIGTAIALAFPRSPTITAMTAWDLDELSGGRFIVGLGSQVKRVNEDRFSVVFEHPAPKLKEYAQVMRTVWAANRGEDVTFEGTGEEGRSAWRSISSLSVTAGSREARGERRTENLFPGSACTRTSRTSAPRGTAEATTSLMSRSDTGTVPETRVPARSRKRVS